MEKDISEMVHCPYNFAHVIHKEKLLFHLTKCRHAHPHQVDKYTICPFNSTHDVPELELEFHVQECPDRKKVESFIFRNTKPEPGVPPTPGLPVSSENWDEEVCQGPSYLEVKDKQLEKKKLFRVPTGLSKRERKAFYKNEVLRFESIRIKENSSDSTN